MKCPKCPGTLQTTGAATWCPSCGYPILELREENSRLKRKLIDVETTVRELIRRLKGLL